MAVETPVISVIVPVYNGKRYLKRCVRSLQAQTEKNIEIILVDDGSTDGSGALCDRLAAQDSRIVVCHQKNSGVSAARNKGLDLARGKYIMFCDSDDTVLPRYCQAHLEVIEQTGAALTMAYAFSLPRARAFEQLSEGQVYCLDYSLLFQLWEERWLWYCWGKCFERERICRTGLRFLTEVTHGEDTIFVVEYILAVLDQPGRIYLWREHLYCYYNTPGSLSKVTAAMISSIEYKMAAGYRLGEATGASTENLVEAFLVDQVHYRNQNFRSMLWECKWYQIRNGVRRTRAVIQTPEFCSMLRDDEKVRVFGNRYRRVLRSGNPLLIYLYFSLWKKKTQLIEHPLIKKLCPRRLERC